MVFRFCRDWNYPKLIYGESSLRKILSVIFITFLLCSCFKPREKALNNNNNFSLKIGFKENEIANFSNDKMFSEEMLSSFYRNGFYYVADIRNNKIMKFTE